MRVGNVIKDKKDVIKVYPSTTIRDAVSKMNNSGSRRVPVVDAGTGRIVGIVTSFLSFITLPTLNIPPLKLYYLRYYHCLYNSHRRIYHLHTLDGPGYHIPHIPHIWIPDP